MLANGDEQNLILPKFARPPFFSSSCFLALPLINIGRRKYSIFLHFSLQLFHHKTLPVYDCRCRSGWESLDHGHYRFYSIKFVNLVVPSPSKTEAYNKYGLLTKLVRSRWLDIGQVLFLRVYGPRRSRLP